ncbi:MAG: MMPL family transporter, partial [Planctomycetota bacterium]
LLLLMFSNFKGMESLAKLSSVSIAVAFAITMLIGPLLLRTLKARAGSRQKSLRRIGSLAGAARASGWPVLVGAAVVLVAAGYGLPQLEFEGDTTKLDAKSSATGESEALLYASFGDAISGRTIMVAEGDTLLDSLATTEAFQNHQRISDFRGLSLLLPSLPAQSRNRSAWRAFFNADKISEIKKIMLQASAVNPSTGKTITFNEARVEAGFADFIAMLEADDRTAIDASSVLNSTGGDMLRQFVLERDGRVYVTSTASSSFAPKYFDGKPIANGHVLLKRNLAVHMVDLIRNDVLKLGLLALLLVTLIVAIKFKNLRLTAAALAPVIGGLVFTLGMMGWFSMPFNVINVMLMVFVAGLGIDYGIFLVASWQDNSESSPAAAGVTVAALTTIIGFGSLTFARHPALFSVGITATIGVSSALAIALLVVPVLLPLRDEDANNS